MPKTRVIFEGHFEGHLGVNSKEGVKVVEHNLNGTLYKTFEEVFMVFIHLRKGHSNAEFLLLLFFSISDRF